MADRVFWEALFAVARTVDVVANELRQLEMEREAEKQAIVGKHLRQQREIKRFKEVA